MLASGRRLYGTAVVKGVTGMRDVPHAVTQAYDHLTRAFFAQADLYGCGKMSTPLVEHAEVFERSLGIASDVVMKEMFRVEDDGGLVLRPEGTAGMLRAVIAKQREANSVGKAQRVAYEGPMFRREKPQRGRLRQFTQMGVEFYGERHPYSDVELIALATTYLESIGLSAQEHFTLNINTVGSEQDRLAYVTNALVPYLEEHREELSSLSVEKLKMGRPLQILDSNNPNDMAVVENAPLMSAHMSMESKERFAAVTQGLETLGIRFHVDPNLVRGLDYYNDTVFEITAHVGTGAQSAIVGGGRYDRLSYTLTSSKKRKTSNVQQNQESTYAFPALGWAAGLERLALVVDAAGAQGPRVHRKSVAVVVFRNRSADKHPCELTTHALTLMQDMRNAGIPCAFSYKSNASAQMKLHTTNDPTDVMSPWGSADVMVILHKNDLQDGHVQVKNTHTKAQQACAMADVLPVVRAMISAHP